MALQSTFFPYSYKLCSRKTPLSPFSTTRFFSICNAPICTGSGTLKLSTPRLGRVVSAVVSDRDAVGSSFSGTDVFKLTYLEGNSWLWDVGGLNILVDPILVGNLDFGIPWLYDAAKKFLKNFQCSLVNFLKLIAY